MVDPFLSFEGDVTVMKNYLKNNSIILPLPLNGRIEVWERLTTILKHGKKKGNNLFAAESRRSSAVEQLIRKYFRAFFVTS